MKSLELLKINRSIRLIEKLVDYELSKKNTHEDVLTVLELKVDSLLKQLNSNIRSEAKKRFLIVG